MAFSRRLGVIGIVGVSWLVAVGCDDDGDKVTNSGDAGEGGEATAGGKSNVGGSSSGNAGKGGMATAGKGGSAGSGGTAGTDAGGVPGIAGGEGGTGPLPNGGAAGDGGGAAGSADGGAAGSAAQLLSCTYECEIDDDCKIGIDDSQKCDLETKRCKDPNLSCAVSNDCVPSASFWFTPGCVDTETDCFDGYTCVEFQGNSYCAALPDADFGCFPYGTVSLALHGGQVDQQVEVCFDADVRCSETGTCFEGCTTTGCDFDGGSTCNETTGLCECETGAECATGVCTNSHCVQCVTSEDCAENAGATGLDTCVAGKCGCSAAATCPAPAYVGATPVCE